MRHLVTDKGIIDPYCTRGEEAGAREEGRRGGGERGGYQRLCLDNTGVNGNKKGKKKNTLE